MFASPFDYPSQCVFGIPNNLPEPREDESGHGAAVVQVVSDLAFAAARSGQCGKVIMDWS